MKTIQQAINEVKSGEYVEGKGTTANRIKNEEKFANMQEGYDFLVCQICGMKAGELTNHISKCHKIDVDAYKKFYGMKTLKCQKIVDSVKGDKNPGYQHGGKFSPFSKKFIKGDISEETVLKATQSRRENGNETTSLEYWLKQTDGNEELAKQLLSERQSTFSLKKCIEKYGEEDGTKRWKERQEKWMNSLYDKSDEELMEINRKKMWAAGAISNVENELFGKLKQHIPEIVSQYQLKRLDVENKFYMYDMQYTNKLIEFNGVYWHAKPELFKPDDIIFGNITAQYTWDKDLNKKKLAQHYGYELYIVWEDDYYNNKEKVVQECLNFLRQ